MTTQGNRGDLTLYHGYTGSYTFRGQPRTLPAVQRRDSRTAADYRSKAYSKDYIGADRYFYTFTLMVDTSFVG
jgi:hypothetical protein